MHCKLEQMRVWRTQTLLQHEATHLQTLSRKRVGICVAQSSGDDLATHACQARHTSFAAVLAIDVQVL